MLNKKGYAIKNSHLNTKKMLLFNNQNVYLMNNGARISKAKFQKKNDRKVHR